VNQESFSPEKYHRLVQTVISSFDNEIKIYLAPEEVKGSLSITFTSNFLVPSSILINQLNSIFDSIFEIEE